MKAFIETEITSYKINNINFTIQQRYYSLLMYIYIIKS